MEKNQESWRTTPGVVHLYGVRREPAAASREIRQTTNAEHDNITMTCWYTSLDLRLPVGLNAVAMNLNGDENSG